MLKLVVTVFMFSSLVSCSKYSEFRKSRRHDYLYAAELPSLKYPVGMLHIEANDMYKIPPIATDNTDISDLPPAL